MTETLIRTAPVLPTPTRTEGAPDRVLAGVVVALGRGWGVLTEHLQGVLADPWAMWANSIAAWVLPAFAVGALAARWRRAAACGVAVEILLLAGYYVARTVQGVPSSLSTLAVWTVGGLVAGVVFGVAGAWWRAGGTGRQVAGAALIGAVFVAEGIQRWVMFPWQGSSGMIMAAAGVVLALVLARGWWQRLLVAGGMAVLLPVAFLGSWVTNIALGSF